MTGMVAASARAIKETENKGGYLENNPFFDWQPDTIIFPAFTNKLESTCTGSDYLQNLQKLCTKLSLVG